MVLNRVPRLQPVELARQPWRDSRGGGRARDVWMDMAVKRKKVAGPACVLRFVKLGFFFLLCC